MDEDPLQSRIYFIMFIESLAMIFSQYIETYEVLLYYPRREEDIAGFTKKAIGEILYANIDVHSRIFIAKFPADGIKCIEKLQ